MAPKSGTTTSSKESVSNGEETDQPIDQSTISKPSAPEQGNTAPLRPENKKRPAEGPLYANEPKKPKHISEAEMRRKRAGMKTRPNIVEPPAQKRRAAEEPGKRESKRAKVASVAAQRSPLAAKDTEGRTRRRRPAGLRNEGNVCYYNAILQTLLQTAPIREYCLAIERTFTDAVTVDDVTPEEVARFSEHATRRSNETKAKMKSGFDKIHPDEV